MEIGKYLNRHTVLLVLVAGVVVALFGFIFVRATIDYMPGATLGEQYFSEPESTIEEEATLPASNVNEQAIIVPDDCEEITTESVEEEGSRVSSSSTTKVDCQFENESASSSINIENSTNQSASSSSGSASNSNSTNIEIDYGE